MDVLVRQPRQLRHPLADISALWIVGFALRHGVEDAEIGRGIGARARDPLPARGVVGGVGIDQRVPEPGFAGPPVLQQVLDQEGGDDHPHAVMHPAGGPELAHAGIDERDAGLAALPAAERVVVWPPGKGVEARIVVAGRKLRIVEEQVVRELAPADLGEEFLGVALRSSRFAGGTGMLEGVPDLARPDLAEMQMGREPRCRGPVRPVAVLGVTGKAAADEIIEPLGGAGFSRRPLGPQAAGPVRLRRLQPEFTQRHRQGLDRSGQGRRRDSRGSGNRSIGLSLLTGRAPVRRENLHRLPGRGRHLPRLVQEMAVETADGDSAPGEVFLERAVECDLRRLVATIPGDESDIGFGRDTWQQRGGIALHQQKSTALRR